MYSLHFYLSLVFTFNKKHDIIKLTNKNEGVIIMETELRKQTIQLTASVDGSHGKYCSHCGIEFEKGEDSNGKTTK